MPSTPPSPLGRPSHSPGSAGRRRLTGAGCEHEVLRIHYGSPMITAANTVLVPTRVSVKAGYRVDAYSGASGAQRWSLNTD